MRSFIALVHPTNIPVVELAIAHAKERGAGDTPIACILGDLLAMQCAQFLARDGINVAQAIAEQATVGKDACHG